MPRGPRLPELNDGVLLSETTGQVVLLEGALLGQEGAMARIAINGLGRIGRAF